MPDDWRLGNLKKKRNTWQQNLAPFQRQQALKRTNTTNTNKCWRRNKIVPTVTHNLNKLLTDIESTKAKIAKKEQFVKDMAWLNQGLCSISLNEDEINIL